MPKRSPNVTIVQFSICSIAIGLNLRNGTQQVTKCSIGNSRAYTCWEWTGYIHQFCQELSITKQDLIRKSRPGLFQEIMAVWLASNIGSSPEDGGLPAKANPATLSPDDTVRAIFVPCLEATKTTRFMRIESHLV